ncbi:MAG: SDR family oxidoreductase [Bacteroidales bacterium]|jgi:NAD(P)-dependent dehydrogenase (short-subunit alcohol dehydrogenase family)|nr:SDR family oxidoreductase [Bacteroidales bacterium]
MKTAIITGAAGGIGFEITKAMTEAGYHVVMACRNIKAAEVKIAEILTCNKNGSIEVIYLDLSDLNSVISFVSEISRKFDSVDLLMNNAGMIPTCFELTSDGFERTVCINYVAPYLLTRKLIPLMPEGARIVNMISCTYKHGKIELPDFFYYGRRGDFRRLSIYSNTKLALLFFTFELSKRLQQKGISVNAADPGIVSTNIIRMKKWFDPLADIFFRPFIKTPEQGASAVIKLLLADEFAGVTGQVSAGGKLKNIKPEYQNQPIQAQLWEDTENLIWKHLGLNNY